MTLQKLEKLVPKIDSGFYPKEILKELGNDGFFSIFKDRKDIHKAIEKIAQISAICGTTGFCTWCQFAIIYYVLNSDNSKLKNEILPKLLSGEILGGTALSNPMKAFCDLEKNRLSAKRVENGYIINGNLAWVSNIESDSIFGAIALLENGEPIMGIVRCDKVKLSDSIKYSSLDGSATKSIFLEDYFMSDDDILGINIYEYLIKIIPGFILLQCGIAGGILESALEILENNQSEANSFLPYKYEVLKDKVNKLLFEISNIDINNTNPKQILNIRLQGSLLVQELTNAAILFSGSTGYFKNAKAQRLQREGNFVLIVTPSIRHLYKEISRVENGGGVIQSFKNKIAQNIK